MTDLRDPRVRDEVTARLGDLWRGRPVVVAPVALAGATRLVAWLRELGCPVLVLATARGSGPLPTDCEVVDLARPATASLTEEVRTHDRLLRRLPADVRAAVEAFDPGRHGMWSTTPFVSTDEPVEGRAVTGGRPRAWLALEDKLLADGGWDAAGVARAPCRHVEVADRGALAAATEELAGPLGVVWSGDARDGLNGGGDFVRWVRDERDRAEAAAFFAPRSDRVRVAPFLEGVPCSIHGMVLPDATAVFRPVEIVVLRSAGRRGFVLAGVGSTWDPPQADREAMRDVARRVGEHLRATHDYRGAFGVDGVLTADGFRPTELNTRLSAGLTVLSEVDRRLFAFLQAALVAGVDPGLTAADLEGLVPLMDAERAGKVTALAGGVHAEASDCAVAWDGRRLTPTRHETGNVLSVGPTPAGMYARVDPCAALVPGQRLAPLCAALHARLDEAHGTSFGPLEPAPDVRRAA